MLKRRDRIERLDMAIAETEVAITEQVLRIVNAEARGRSRRTARRVLGTLYGLLIEYRRARDLIVEARRLKEDGPQTEVKLSHEPEMHPDVDRSIK